MFFFLAENVQNNEVRINEGTQYLIIFCVYHIMLCFGCTCILNIESTSTGCACPKIYIPLCGDNGVTYANECEMNCS